MLHIDTIVALSSGALPSGVAVVRASGPGARVVMERLAGGVPPGRRASLRRFRNAAGDTIDRGIALFFEAPDTVTGEDVAEFHLHGGRAVVTALLEAATEAQGVRAALPGEFTRRAFENGRIDLTEAEGLADLVAAETEGQRRMAVAESGGALRTVYEGWQERLTAARARLEASFDFADEGDVGDDVAAGVDAAIGALAADLRAHLTDAKRGEILKGGYKVAIVGPPNAGKSSLLNALAEREVAIVTEVPGTTRDVIEATLDLNGIPVRFSDTAGIRETADKVEAIGIERARAVMDDADLVLALIDPQAGPGPLARLTDLLTHVKHPMLLAAAGGEIDDVAQTLRRPKRNILTVRTKLDRPERHGIAARIGLEGQAIDFDFSISVKTGEGLPQLVERIAALAAAAAGNLASAIPMRTRHRDLIRDTLRILDEFAAEKDAPAEVRAETLRRAGNRLGALTGAVGVEDLLDVIFSEFCIGK